ncbi:MAG: hypothetical protein M3327_09420, partial [Actinomycetota bacterium]|nr:hypothetical protein [Actinomycetota bacterium]
MTAPLPEVASGPAVLLFVHAECPTARLTLSRLAGVRPPGRELVVVAQESAARARELARGVA